MVALLFQMAAEPLGNRIDDQRRDDLAEHRIAERQLDRFGVKDVDLIGDFGGEVIFKGTPEQIIKCEKSYTGKYLKKYLE